ncbi:MAG TPA: ATP-dependent Clp protease proteolytic subunit [Phycisphaerae bacterium]|nr:ATP-dependent Clp protease proteolytic subunit [Phycisphaerae bacterium]HOI54528.1 ATP-dependent Clp protease proteolytic subunit [Phycisphaerae bacterium]
MAYQDYQRQRWMTLQDMLLENRIIFLEGGIDDAVANNVVMKLLYLHSEKKNEDISLYINSPGGYLSSTMAIYDTMQFIECNVATYCIGIAASGAALLLTGGAPGKRFILPHAKAMIHQPAGEVGGQAADIEIAAREVLKDKETLISLFARHCKKSADEVRNDIERDRYLSAQESVAYGLVDEVLGLETPGK